MVLAAESVPVGFLAMPTLGTTAPATLAGALAMADAEVISATVLTQMVNPGAPVFHSIMQAWADPSSGKYVSYPLDPHGRYAPVDHGPSLGDAVPGRLLRDRRHTTPAHGSPVPRWRWMRS